MFALAPRLTLATVPRLNVLMRCAAGAGPKAASKFNGRPVVMPSPAPSSETTLKTMRFAELALERSKVPVTLKWSYLATSLASCTCHSKIEPPNKATLPAVSVPGELPGERVAPATTLSAAMLPPPPTVPPVFTVTTLAMLALTASRPPLTVVAPVPRPEAFVTLTVPWATVTATVVFAPASVSLPAPDLTKVAGVAPSTVSAEANVTSDTKFSVALAPLAKCTRSERSSVLPDSKRRVEPLARTTRPVAERTPEARPRMPALTSISALLLSVSPWAMIQVPTPFLTITLILSASSVPPTERPAPKLLAALLVPSSVRERVAVLFANATLAADEIAMAPVPEASSVEAVETVKPRAEVSPAPT